MSLNREGQYGQTNVFGDIDNLTYKYNGNQIQWVDDLDGVDNQNNGFRDKGSSFTNNSYAPDYKYDKNGNLIQDMNKNIYKIVYNSLNLPTEINFYDPVHGNKKHFLSLHL